MVVDTARTWWPSRLEGLLLRAALLEKAARYDGVWWPDGYAPQLNSMPRGLIFQSKVKEYAIVEIADAA